MKSIKNNYKNYVKNKMPKTSHLTNAIKAFFIGGLICVLGEAINYYAKNGLYLNEEKSAAFQAIVLVFIGATLTGIGIYDKIGKFAGAGSIVPITGFANSIVSPAMEFKSEGIIMGTGAKLFTLAGPVLVNGVFVSVVIGIIYFIIGSIT